MASEKTLQLRGIIRRARRLDLIVALLGLLAMSVAILTLAAPNRNRELFFLHAL